MKLTKAQNELLNRMTTKIDFARTHTLTEWAQERKGYTEEKIDRMIKSSELYRKTPEEMMTCIANEISNYAETYADYYNEERSGIVNVICNSKPLKKLEEYGLIEILYDSTGTGFGLDTVKVLNY